MDDTHLCIRPDAGSPDVVGWWEQEMDNIRALLGPRSVLTVAADAF